MDDEQDTREVLFPQWMGPEEHGLTIEQTGQGEIFVKEVKEEFPAAHTGTVHEGDQIVGATIYFDNMSSGETAELLKSLNRHKVGLKLQNKSGDKSPCRSPMGTLSWEGRGGFGGSSSDILLSGDEDYKRIYTKKIKPRLKSEDLAEGVDVRTERHSSTSSDGRTITTITRRITTYTVDIPGGTDQVSSPEVKIQVSQHEPFEGDSAQIRLPHGSAHRDIKTGEIHIGGPKVIDSSVKTTCDLDRSEQEISINVSDTGLLEGEGPGHSGRTVTVEGSAGLSGRLETQVGNVLGLKDSSLMAGTELATAKGPVLDTHISGFSISGGTGDSYISGKKGRESSSVALKDGSDDKTKLSQFSIDIQRPKVNTKRSESEICERSDFTMPSVEDKNNLPKLKISESVSTEDISGGFKVPKMDTDILLSQIKIKTPKIDIQTTDVDIKGHDGKIKSPEFKMPSISGTKISMPDVDFNLKGPKLKGDGDVSAPKVEGGIKTPKIDIETSDIEGPEGGFKMPKIKMPSFGLRGPKAEGPDVDIKMPKADVDIKAPDVDIKGPELDIEGPEGKIKGPKFKMPSISGPKLYMPDVDFNLKGPKLKGDVDVSVSKIEGDIKAPKVEGDIKAPKIETSDIEGPEGGFKMPKIKMPSFGLKGPNTEGPDIDFKIPKADVDIKSPNIDIKGPELDIEGPEGKIKGPKFKMPSISGPKLSMPDVDFNLKGPKLKGDVDVSVPKVEGGDVEVPKIHMESPNVELDVSDASLKKTEQKFQMPKFGFKGPKIVAPDVDINFAVKGPERDVQIPNVDITVPNIKAKGSNLKMGSISGPNVSLRDVDLNLKGSKVKAEAGVSVEGDVSVPKVEVGSPSLELKSPEGGFKMPKFKMPKIGFKSPKGEIDVNIPGSDFSLKSPDIDMKSPDIDIEGPEGKIKGQKFKMPSITGPKITTPDVDFNVKGPKVKGDVNVSVPKIEGDLKPPKLDIEGPDVNMEGPEGGFKMPKIKMASFGLKGPKVEGPEIDVNLPKADVDIKGPEIDIRTSDLDIEGPEGKTKGPKFKMPSISGPKITMPDVDFNLKGPKVKGDVDVSVPKIEGDLKAPKLDIEGPDVNIEGPEGGFKMPKIKMASFGLKGPKVEGPEIDVNLPKADVDIKGPEIDIKTPDFDIEGLEAKIKGPKFKMPSISGPKISVPDLTLKGPKVKGDVDVSVPKIEGDLKAPKVDIKSPDLDIKGPKGGVKVKSPKFNDPSFGIKGGSVSIPEKDMEGNINVKSPDVSISGPDANIKVPKTKKSKFSFGGKSPKLDADIPDVGGSVEGPDMSVDVKGKKGKFKLAKAKGKSKPFDGDMKTGNVKETNEPDVQLKSAKVKKPLFGKLHFPDVEFDIKSPKMKGTMKSSDIDLPSASLKTDIQGVDVQTPNTSLETPDFKGKEGKIKMPKCSTSGSKLTAPDLEVRDAVLNTSGKSVSLHVPDAGGSSINVGGKQDVDFEMPSVNVHGGALDAGVNLTEHKAVKGSVEMSDLAVRGQIGEITDGMEYQKGHVTFPKLKVPKFGIALPKVEGREMEVDVGSGKLDAGGKVSSQNLEIHNADVKNGAKAKVTMPKVFVKPQSTGGSAADLTVQGVTDIPTKGGAKVSKEISLSSGELASGKIAVEGLKVSLKSKSASLDLFKKSQHRPSSMGDEGGLPSPISAEGHLQAEGGNISVDVGETKVKGKKGKINFATIGGFGSKSKGSYEVTLGDESRARTEVAGEIAQPSMSRMSSTSINESGSKGSFRLPELEIAVSPKK